MNIVDYSQKDMALQVRDLFLAIYPNKPEISERMCFDENIDRHICTKIAFVDGKAVGQANVFLMKGSSDVANLGYHVHPDFHKQGVAFRLSEEVIKDAKDKGVKVLLVRTDASNIASINLGKKLGFVKPPTEFLDENKDMISHKDVKDMVCLYKVLY